MQSKVATLLHILQYFGKEKQRKKLIFLIWGDYKWFEKYFSRNWESRIFLELGVVWEDLIYDGSYFKLVHNQYAMRDIIK